MNSRKVLNILGKIIITEVILMIPSLIVALVYGDGDALYFASTMVVSLIFGLALNAVKIGNARMTSKDGYCIVAFAWIIISLIGAVPMYMSGCFDSFWAALFETVSGFTTTGASIMAEPAVLPHGVLFFRSFTHWVGGMGVLVFVMMIMPMENENSMHIVRAEVPGPIAGKLVPRMKKTSMINYGIYTAMTVILFILLLFGSVKPYDAMCLAFGTAGTGGFALTSAGIGGYDSLYVEVLLGIFMILFGVNFNAYYFLLIRRFKDAFKNEEVWWYFGFIAFSVVTITINIVNLVGSAGTALRQAFFQVASIITTTGFGTADFEQWPEFSKHLLVLLMIVGACSGSTGGGMKISRVIILVKSFFTEIKHILDPRAVSIIRLNGKKLDKEILISTRIYATSYFILMIIIVLIISLDGFDFTTNVTAVISCFNNIGPGLNKVGPSLNFACFSDWVKVVLSMAMITGRLEIFPIFMIFTKSVHDKKIIDKKLNDDIMN